MGNCVSAQETISVAVRRQEQKLKAIKLQIVQLGFKQQMNLTDLILANKIKELRKKQKFITDNILHFTRQQTKLDQVSHLKNAKKLQEQVNREARTQNLALPQIQRLKQVVDEQNQEHQQIQATFRSMQGVQQNRELYAQVSYNAAQELQNIRNLQEQAHQRQEAEDRQKTQRIQKQQRVVCCICIRQIPYTQRFDAVILNCNHLMHTKCFPDWMNKKKNCQLCQAVRGNVNPYKL